MTLHSFRATRSRDGQSSPQEKLLALKDLEKQADNLLSLHHLKNGILPSGRSSNHNKGVTATSSAAPMAGSDLMSFRSWEESQLSHTSSSPNLANVQVKSPEVLPKMGEHDPT